MKETYYQVKDECRAALLSAPSMSEATAEDLRVLLALVLTGAGTADSLAKALSMPASAIAAALAFWRGAGLIATTDKRAEQQAARPPKSEGTLHEAGAEELADSIRTSGLAGLITAAEQQRGRLFNRSDLAILVGLSEELGLDGPYILTLLAYCDAQGDGSPKPMRYVERVALRLCEHEITSCSALEEYIRNEEALHSVEGVLRRMFGIGTRKLTEREESAFKRWTQEYGYGEEIIGAAYDVTVNATSRASVAYTAKILAHWYEEGVKTPEDAEALLAREKQERKQPTKKRKASEPSSKSFNVDDFFSRALDRSFKSETKND